ncbi:hypothetical protein [Arenimonas sp. MALMAid1274]|uniref:hypothetical protein n=1 Tax=Arenimonas sp. MALMAid1274 TaxID=3411630 RepID=UPI003B9E4060
MTASRPLMLALCLALSALSSSALAQTPPPTPKDNERTGDEKYIMSTTGFLDYHPDLRHRLAGQGHYRKKRYEQALASFMRGARFADKPSQAMVGEMLWKGEGAPMDRPMAYLWMDIAAERGYRLMLAKREHYWNALTEAERARALELGDALYGEYADAYAKPRMERQLRRARLNRTGSRVGANSGFLQIEIPGPGGSRVVDGSTYYADKYWKPSEYWRMQDEDWKEFGEGTVEIGDIQSVGEPTIPEDESESPEADPR